MLSEERKVKIMQMVRKDGFVSVVCLMEQLDASRSSIMRDLDELEKKHLIVRQRGGASLMQTMDMINSSNELAVSEKEYEHKEQKKRICQQAAKGIEDGSCIYIDTGTTVLYLMEQFQNKDVSIVSANVHLLEYLPESFCGKIYILGGEYSKKYDSNYGDLTLQMMNQFHFDYAFFTTNGIDWDRNEVYAYNISYSTMKKKAMERSRTRFLLCDSTKQGNHGLCSWASTTDFDVIYMDTCDAKEVTEQVVLCE